MGATHVGRVLGVDRRNVTLEIVHVNGDDTRKTKLCLRCEDVCLDAAISLLGKEVTAEIKGGKFVGIKERPSKKE